MTIARLATIPCISVKEISQTCIHITAADGFRLTVNKQDRMGGPFWAFENSPPSAISHFNLRYRIHQELNV